MDKCPRTDFQILLSPFIIVVVRIVFDGSDHLLMEGIYWSLRGACALTCKALSAATPWRRGASDAYLQAQQYMYFM